MRTRDAIENDDYREVLLSLWYQKLRENGG